MASSTLAYKRRENKIFIQKENKHSVLWTNGTNCFNELMVIPSTDKMPDTDIPQEAFPLLILAKIESGGTVEVASATMCSFTHS